MIDPGARPMRNVIPLALVASAALLGGCFHRPPPAAPAGPSGSLADVGPRLNNWSQASVPADGLIVVSGDDFVKADATPPRIKRRKGLALNFAQAVGEDAGVKVEDETVAGSTLKLGAARFAAGPAPNLVVISYGFGDADAGTDPAAYRNQLQKMIAAAHARGAAVYVVVPPPTKAPISVKTEPFRLADRDLAAANGAGLIDVAPPPKPGAPAAPTPVGVVTPVDKPAQIDIALVAGQVAQYVKLAPARGGDGGTP